MGYDSPTSEALVRGIWEARILPGWITSAPILSYAKKHINTANVFKNKILSFFLPTPSRRFLLPRGSILLCCMSTLSTFSGQALSESLSGPLSRGNSCPGKTESGHASRKASRWNSRISARRRNAPSNRTSDPGRTRGRGSL